jgi:signal transduction histidine kinase
MPSLGQKLFASFAALFILLAVTASLAAGMIGRLARTFDRIFHENLATVHACGDMRRAAEAMRDAALLPAGEGALGDTAAEAFAGRLAFQRGNVTLPGERVLTDSLAAAWAEYRELFASLRDSAVAPAAARARFLTLFRRIEDLTGRIADINSGNIVSADGQLRSQATAARRSIAFVLLVGGVLSAALLFFSGRMVLAPIRALLISAHEIEKGNLDLSLEVRSRDELGRLAAAFNSMAARLREFRRSDRARLLLTERTTQMAIDSMPDAVAVLDPEGIVELSNEAAQDLFGIRPGTRASAAGLAWLPELFAKALREGRPVDPQGYSSAVQVFRGGEERFFLPRLIPIREAGGQIHGVTLVLADVTGLRRLDEAKSDLLSTVSHEFKTRLTSVRMAAHLLLDSKLGELNARQAELIMAAREDAEHLHRMIEGLLDIGRIRSGNLGLELGPMPAADLAERSLEGIRHAFQDKGLKLAVDLPADLPGVLADPARARLVLDNLLSNALKYTPAGGSVRVTAVARDAFVEFRVADTGPGIPSADLPKVFERFYRGGRERGGGGAGLGLAIAREVAEAHGGLVTVESAEGRGSTFRFSLRRAGGE